MKTIEIIVTADGQSRVETKGFVGSECQQASHFMEQALGSRQGEHLKAEFHQTSVSEQQRTSQG
ncbi:DUF2997 domain-containing protein [Rosistilla oblonga]|uniref:DUF2997 domain-containing protein n=1 Tax=Rosistilla oblonga TaxID=2527990 RepID=UPI003A977125